MDFEQLKTKNSTKILFSTNNKTRKYWYPEISSRIPHRNIIRFLPASSKNTQPIYSFYTHTYSFNGRYKTVVCSKEEYGVCPICEFLDFYKKVSKQLNLSIDPIFNLRRTKRFIANIYVIEDGRNQNNNNNVFVYKFGQKIFDKLQSFYESFENNMVDIFSFWSGYDFILRVDFSGPYPNYDKSSFKANGNVLMNFSDEELKKLWLSEYDLESEIKSLDYDALKDDFYSFYDSVTREELLSKITKVDFNEILSVVSEEFNVKDDNKDKSNNDSYSDYKGGLLDYCDDEDDEDDEDDDDDDDDSNLDSVPF